MPDAPQAERIIFISYAHSDRDFVTNLTASLEEKGVTVWTDEKISPGARYDHEIAAAIQRCTHLVVVLTPEALGSQYVDDETHLALDQKKRVIPIRLRACNDVWWRVRRLQYADFTRSRQKGLAALLRAILEDRNESLQKPKWYWRFATPARGVAFAAAGTVLAVWAVWAIMRPPPPPTPCPSDTRGTVIETGRADALKLHLENRGCQNATVQGGYRLKFGGPPIADDNLQPANGNATAVVPAHSTLEVYLVSPRGFRSKDPKSGRRLTAAQTEPQIVDRMIRLEIDVLESDDPAPGRMFHVRTTSFPAKGIWNFIANGLSTIFIGGAHAA